MRLTCLSNKLCQNARIYGINFIGSCPEDIRYPTLTLVFKSA